MTIIYIKKEKEINKIYIGTFQIRVIWQSFVRREPLRCYRTDGLRGSVGVQEAARRRRAVLRVKVSVRNRERLNTGKIKN